MSKNYVVGFLFDDAERNVVLIEKKRPDWQAGKLNGVGGRIELGESPSQTMRREFREEAGQDVATWKPVVTMQGDRWLVFFFKAFGFPHLSRTMTDENVSVVDVKCLPEIVLPKLKWLIPLCLDSSVFPSIKVTCSN